MICKIYKLHNSNSMESRGAAMNTVIKGTKTIAEYKRVREDMENLARANYARHKEAFEEWREGEPIKAWFDFEGNFCIEYESGKWWHYNDKGEWW